MTKLPGAHGHDFVREFLYGPAELARKDGRIRTSVVMDERMEGWIGIPHGGISMGIMMDLAMAMDGHLRPDVPLYPVYADFRLGGATVRIGDTLTFSISTQAGGVTGEALAVDDPLPYMSATIHHAQDVQQKDHFPSFLPEKAEDLLGKLTPLPFYRKCFVCGVQRSYPGLKRRFHLWDGPGKIVISAAGFDTADRDDFFRFQSRGVLHPLPVLALLDETLGWSGFLLSASGAVTVRIDYVFYRPIKTDEKLLFFGRGDRVRGKAGSRLMFWASGGAAAVKADGRLEMVVRSSGQWYGMPELTAQMQTSLLPRDLMKQVFQIPQPT